MCVRVFLLPTPSPPPPKCRHSTSRLCFCCPRRRVFLRLTRGAAPRRRRVYHTNNSRPAPGPDGAVAALGHCGPGAGPPAPPSCFPPLLLSLPPPPTSPSPRVSGASPQRKPASGAVPQPHPQLHPRLVRRDRGAAPRLARARTRTRVCIMMIPMAACQNRVQGFYL